MSVARYNLRASPAAGIGGMYATAEGEDLPIGTAPLTPELVDQQNVRVINIGATCISHCRINS